MTWRPIVQLIGAAVGAAVMMTSDIGERSVIFLTYAIAVLLVIQIERLRTDLQQLTRGK